MATIEERILRMRFDNAQFRRASQETRQDLANLKKDMKLDGVTSGLGNIAKVSGKSFGSINKGASSVRLDLLVSELDKVTNKFSAEVS